jgi:probable HAF family extracellular repeat protein
MKSRILTCFIAMTLFAALALPVQLAAQHTRFKLIDIGTFGGPVSFVSEDGDESQVLNNRGMVAGEAETPEPDPYAPNCSQPNCFVSHVFRWDKGVLTDLGALPGRGISSFAGEMNQRGWIAGQSENGEIDPLVGIPEGRAILWKGDQIIDLGTLGGHESGAFYVTDGGEVVGGSTINAEPDPFSLLPWGSSVHAFIWDRGAMTDLGTLGGPDSLPSIACTGLRNGLVAGTSYTNSNPNDTTGVPTQHAFLWENGTMTDIPTLGGTFAGVQCANNQGQVIGQSNLTGDLGCNGSLNFCAQHAFSWDHGNLMDLGTLGGSFSLALSLNNEGQTVGGANTTDDKSFHATLWRRGQIADLGTLDGDCLSLAHAINSEGQLTGQSFSCPDGSISRAVLWDKGSIIDLNATIPANSTLQLTVGFNINNRGEIAGVGLPPGCDNADLCGHVFLLIPCAGGQGCEGIDGSSARTNSPAITRNTVTKSQRRHMTKQFVAKLRARLAQRYHIPGLGASPRD